MFFAKIKKRDLNLIEHLVLFLGVIIIGIGYFFVRGVMIEFGTFSYQATVCILLWIILIISIVLTAISENSKEELKIIIQQQHAEMKLLRDDLKRKR
jgi:surface polysaccharide O-acyltransferase-like enzyme